VSDRFRPLRRLPIHLADDRLSDTRGSNPDPLPDSIEVWHDDLSIVREIAHNAPCPLRRKELSDIGRRYYYPAKQVWSIIVPQLLFNGRTFPVVEDAPPPITVIGRRLDPLQPP